MVAPHRLYFDDNLSMGPVIVALRNADVTVVTSDEAGNRGVDDFVHLEYATRLGFVVVTSDLGDFSRLHWEWLAEGKRHAGIVLVRQRTALGSQIRGLLHVQEAVSPSQMAGALLYLSRFIEAPPS